MKMKTTRRLPSLRQLILTLATASVILAPAWTILADSSPALAAPTAPASPVQPKQARHGGPNYWSITGVRVGAPSEYEISRYGGSHKHSWVEQQLYGPGVVVVPHVDTTVHQSR
jgi:hypothetical protein